MTNTHAGLIARLDALSARLAQFESDAMTVRDAITALSAPVTPVGWIIGNGAGDKWRCAFDPFTNSEWVDDRNKALKFATRADAESYSEHDEDAWLVQEIALSAPVTLAQAMQCPEVQAMVGAVRSYEVACESWHGAKTASNLRRAGQQRNVMFSALAPFFALSANNERKPNAD